MNFFPKFLPKIFTLPHSPSCNNALTISYKKISHCRICACDIFVYNYLSYIPNIFSNKPPIFSPINSQFSLRFSKLSPLSNVFLKIILYNKSRHPRLYRQLRPRFKSRLFQKVLHMRLHSTLRNIKFFCYLIISYARCK